MGPRVFPLKVVHHLCCPLSPSAVVPHCIASCSYFWYLLLKYWLSISNTILAHHVIQTKKNTPKQQQHKNKPPKQNKSKTPKTTTNTTNETTKPNPKTVVHAIFLLTRSNPLGPFFSPVHTAVAAPHSVHLRLQHQIQTHSRPRCFVSASGRLNGQDQNLLTANQANGTVTGSRYSDADGHTIPLSTIHQTCPCRQKKPLEHLAPASSTESKPPLSPSGCGESWAPIQNQLGEALDISSQIRLDRVQGKQLKIISGESWPNQLKWSVMVQTTLEVWVCIGRVQESVATRDGLRQASFLAEAQA